MNAPATTDQPPVLRTVGLTKRYGEVTALDYEAFREEQSTARAAGRFGGVLPELRRPHGRRGTAAARTTRLPLRAGP